MPDFDIVKTIEPKDTFRVSSVLGAFDLEPAHFSERFKGNINIEGKDWNVGIIVGGSGTGKSTIAKDIFKDNYFKGYKYKAQSVLDDMPKGVSIKDIQLTFTSVGFSSPPSWLKPYSVLSNGEKMRADLARVLCENKDLIVFDEFTSVVNREVAKVGSYAISKAVRKKDKKFIAVTCHKDVVDWLEPDWLYDTDKQEFFFIQKQTDQNGQTLSSKYTGVGTKIKKTYGEFLGSIII